MVTEFSLIFFLILYLSFLKTIAWKCDLIKKVLFLWEINQTVLYVFLLFLYKNDDRLTACQFLHIWVKSTAEIRTWSLHNTVEIQTNLYGGAPIFSTSPNLKKKVGR